MFAGLGQVATLSAMLLASPPEVAPTELSGRIVQGDERPTVTHAHHRGKRGWAYSKYVACCRPPGATPPTTQTIELHYLTGLDPAGDNWLALRTAPGLSGRRLAKMGPETLVYVVSRSGDWLEVVVQNTRFEGYRGFAHSRYIACCRTVAVP